LTRTIRVGNCRSNAVTGKARIQPAKNAQTNVCRSLDRNEAVIKDVLGLSKVDLAMNVYDKSSPEDIRAGLRVVAAICYQAVCYQRLQGKRKTKVEIGK